MLYEFNCNICEKKKEFISQDFSVIETRRRALPSQSILLVKNIHESILYIQSFQGFRPLWVNHKRFNIKAGVEPGVVTQVFNHNT